ncbi:DUF1146 family protein [Streptococcus oriscaviae]|uniref:DUF1146 family protein n=1 Tax=Streptococcus oriscaviae TaxID=2781599 RepID=A0ABX7YMG9_9STRE|nr:DUF1146 family protein [Streptococcus oriscaviae]QUE54786.1 DUF1146 family protein [Streptococcus oriscaviae]
MITSFLEFLSHILFIYIAHHLLVTVVDWSKWMKVSGNNQRKIQLLILFFAIALGYLVSTFFLHILAIGRSLSLGLS